MATGDIIALAMLTSLFIAFAATMVWVEMTLGRQTAVRTPAETAVRRKRRPF